MAKLRLQSCRESPFNASAVTPRPIPHSEADLRRGANPCSRPALSQLSYVQLSRSPSEPLLNRVRVRSIQNHVVHMCRRIGPSPDDADRTFGEKVLQVVEAWMDLLVAGTARARFSRMADDFDLICSRRSSSARESSQPSSSSNSTDLLPPLGVQTVLYLADPATLAASSARPCNPSYA